MILITGGAGFIGSHTCAELIQAGYEVLILDNFSNANPRVLTHLARICGQEIPYVQADVRDRPALERVFAEHRIEAVIHFAGLKAVGESVQKPLAYYHNNIVGALSLLEVMAAHDVKRMVFSSSATVYGQANPCPYTEDMPRGQTANPYGETKAMIERMLEDICLADPAWSVSILRYFNPIGAHPSGEIGESPNGIPNNLCPYIAQVASGIRPELMVFGADYATPDGTGLRDYIHVADLAAGHVKALERLLRQPGLDIYNLGTGQGTSVLELLHAFEQAAGKTIPYRITDRRAGDLASSFANVDKAKTELGWTAERGIRQMCEDAWRWQQKYPNGYEE